MSRCNRNLTAFALFLTREAVSLYRMKVMIVDDEADIREILSFNLSAAGYDTIRL